MKPIYVVFVLINVAIISLILVLTHDNKPTKAEVLEKASFYMFACDPSAIVINCMQSHTVYSHPMYYCQTSTSAGVITLECDESGCMYSNPANLRCTNVSE